MADVEALLAEAQNPATSSARLRQLFDEVVVPWDDQRDFADVRLPIITAIGLNPNLPTDILLGNYGVDDAFVHLVLANPSFPLLALTADAAALHSLNTPIIGSMSRSYERGATDIALAMRKLAEPLLEARSAKAQWPLASKTKWVSMQTRFRQSMDWVVKAHSGKEETGFVDLLAAIEAVEARRQQPDIETYRKRQRILFRPMPVAQAIATFRGSALP